MLEACQHIYTHYITEKDSTADSLKLVHEIDMMIPEIESVISSKSEVGGNTVLFEKIKTDFLYIRDDIKL